MISKLKNNLSLAIIGSQSMIGSRFCELASGDFNLIKADLKGNISIDLTDEKSVSDFFNNYTFTWLILFSAFTNVDDAEKQRNDKNGICWKINVDGVNHVAKYCQKFQRKLIFISTDFVFDGTDGPYSENDPTGPNLDLVSWYGITKIEAEKVIKNHLSNFIILRIAYPYRSRFDKKDDIVKRTLRLYQEGNLYPMFVDQIFTPTFIDDIAPTIKLLLKKSQTGIFHLASPKTTNQFEFTKEVIEVFGGDPQKVQKSSIREFLKQPGKTPRPVKGGLKVGKITSLGFNPTDWQRGIRLIYQQSPSQI